MNSRTSRGLPPAPARGKAPPASAQKSGSAAPQAAIRAPAWLLQAAQLLRNENAESAAQWLKREHAKGRLSSSLTEAQMIEQLAKAVSVSHPQAALDLLQEQLAQTAPSAGVLVTAGLLQDKLGQRKQSRESLRRLLACAEASPLQVILGANLLVRLGDQIQALEAAKKAFEQLGSPLSQASTMLYIAQVTADWPLAEQLTAQLRQGYADGQMALINESPRTHLLWCDDEATNLEVLAHWSRQNLAAPRVAAPAATAPQGRRLKVGYLSSDFREHPTARLILGVLRHHDRSRVELFMYCSGWDDGSELRKSVEACCEHVHSVAGLSDAAAAQLMRSHGLDVLVELNGPTRAHRMGILSHRPAPVQIDYLGWPGSVGGRVVDYVVGDSYTVPEGAEKAYPERVIRLYPTYQANDHAAQRLPARPSRQAVGLPEDPALRILGMFNAINKVHQTVWDTWMRILAHTENTVLWILDPGVAARRHIELAAQAAGLARGRLVFAPRLAPKAHLARLQCCDLILDPWPYGGHTSTADALYAGVPVLALEGRNFAARVSAGLIRAAGFESMVVQSPDDYVRRAVALLGQPGALAALGEQVRVQARRSEVFNSALRARQLEGAYQTAVDRAAKGLPPVHINTRPASAKWAVPASGAANAARTATATAMAPQPAAPSAGQVPDRSKYRVAVVTPYFRIDPEKFRRCCESVAAQTWKCDHIVVADGEPQDLPQGLNLIHLVLPANVGNTGATPRGLGGVYAIAQGYDAVAFLDADNWYDPGHIEGAVRALESQQLDVVYARRHLVFPDGEVLPQEDEQDAGATHVDTNCFVISRRAAFLLGTWALYPKEFGSGEDRYIKVVADAMHLRTGLLRQKSVWYETNWDRHYQMANKTPVAPLRKPARTIAHNFDAELFYQRTGLRLQLKRTAPAAGSRDNPGS